MQVTTSTAPEMKTSASANLTLLEGILKSLNVQPYMNPATVTIKMWT